MSNPRPEKVAAVAEVKDKLSASNAAVLTEYRGLDVPAMAALRKSLREAGGEYKVYKNTMVRFAAAELGLEIDDLLTGPTAIAFVSTRPDGSTGDAASISKALRDFAKGNDHLVIKGGLLDDAPLSVEEINALADLPPREQMMAELAGAMESMFQDFAGLLDSKLREFSYAMQELVDKGVLPEGEAPAPAAEEAAAEEAPAEEAAAEEAPAEEAAAEEAPAEDAPVEEAAAEEAAAEEAPAEPEGSEDAEASTDEAAASDAGDDDASEEATDEDAAADAASEDSQTEES